MCPPRGRASALYATGTIIVKLLQYKLRPHQDQHAQNYSRQHHRTRHGLYHRGGLPQREVAQFVGRWEWGSIRDVENLLRNIREQLAWGSGRNHTPNIVLLNCYIVLGGNNIAIPKFDFPFSSVLLPVFPAPGADHVWCVAYARQCNAPETWRKI